MLPHLRFVSHAVCFAAGLRGGKLLYDTGCVGVLLQPHPLPAEPICE